MRKILDYFLDIFTLLGQERRRILPILMVLILSSFLDLVGLGLIGGYISALSTGADASHGSSLINKVVGVIGGDSPLGSLGVALILLFSIKALLGLGAQRMIIRFSLKQMMTLRLRVFDLMQSMTYQNFVKLNSAEVLRAIVSYTTQFNVVIMTLLKLVGDGILALAIITFLAILEPQLMTLVLLVGVAIVLIWDRVFRHELVSRGHQMNHGDGLLFQGIQEATQGFKEIKILGGEPFFADLVRDGAKLSMMARLYTGTVSATPRFLVEWIAVCFIVVFSWVTLSRGFSGDLVFATLGMFAVAAVRLAPLATQAMFSVSQLRTSKPAIDGLLSQLKSSAPAVETLPHSPPIREVNFRELSLKDVDIGHDRAALPLISEVNLSVRRGDWIGIVGDSGTGKTTLIDTILGLVEPQGGQISFNGRVLAEDLRSWHARAAYIPQETFILDADLAQNITLEGSEERIDEDKLQDVVEKSQLRELVSSLPLGVKARLGERGSLISGGQRQRVAIARALYHDREVLILDEATSGLDLETEREILQELKNLGDKVTAIVVSHRHETLQFCDAVYQVRDAKLIRH